ncbi:hypothetical protein EI94DRAFT_475427 [Lactarius quietus]|nr:hypothetical protein EI94DRAFT_475427 [Lactarius quietus]
MRRPDARRAGALARMGHQYFTPIARDALALREHPDPDLKVLAQSTVLLLARRALIAYRAFLEDIARRAIEAGNTSGQARKRVYGELQARKSSGLYLLRVLREVLQGLGGVITEDAGSTLARESEGLLRGSLFATGLTARGPGGGGAARGGGAEGDLIALATADLPKAKACLAVLFMVAACSLPADSTGEETLKALAAPLAWTEPCPYYDEPDAAMRLFFNIRNELGDRLTVLDADAVVELYHKIHDPRHQRAQPSSSTTTGAYPPRRGWSNWRQGTR